MNTQALEHEGAMVEVYSKMKPDAFPSQLQNVRTAYYEDIKGCCVCKRLQQVQGGQPGQVQVRGPR